MKRTINILIIFLLVMSGIVIFSNVKINLPGNNQGYAPEQPIAFSHRVHSGDLKMDCLYCHSDADKSRHAGIPSSSTCMNCHRFITASWDKQKIEEQNAEIENRDAGLIISEEVEKIYRSIGFNSESMKYDSSINRQHIEWIRVHKLPDVVYFPHLSHVNAGVACQSCHGAVETMERLEQFEDLSMGWCVNCHRDVNNGELKEYIGLQASIDCGVCHF